MHAILTANDDIKHNTHKTSDWYLGKRPESALSIQQIKTMNQLMSSTDKNSEIAQLVRTLYISATTGSVVADHLYNVSIRAENELSASHERVQKLETKVEELCSRHEKSMDEIVKKGKEVCNNLLVEDRQRRETELAIARLNYGLTTQREDIETLAKRVEIHMEVFKQMRESLICPICREVSSLPKVLGTCGHIACQNCLKQLDEVAFSAMTGVGGVSARQHLLVRRCPLCRAEIIGQGFPVLALKNVASLLVENNLIEVPERVASMSTSAFERETLESRHMAVLQMGCWVQSQLAQHSATRVTERVMRDQWLNGVYILFEAAVSRVFFETFATSLHGKAGGVNVLVNTSQRMLAVQLIVRPSGSDAKAPAPPPEPLPADPAAGGLGGVSSPNPKQHVLIKVSSDGNFSTTLTLAAAATVTS